MYLCTLPRSTLHCLVVILPPACTGHVAKEVDRPTIVANIILIITDRPHIGRKSNMIASPGNAIVSVSAPVATDSMLADKRPAAALMGRAHG